MLPHAYREEEEGRAEGQTEGRGEAEECAADTLTFPTDVTAGR